MPLEETLVISDELGIKHPTNPKTGEPIVMTTDFLLTVNKSEGSVELARTIKMKDELLKERVLEKFEIERVYWKKRGVDWGIVTELEIPKTLARNISYIHDYYDIQQYDAFQNISPQFIEDLGIELLKRVLDTDKSIREITNLFDKEVHVSLGSGMTLFYHLLTQKIIQIDMLKQLIEGYQLRKTNDQSVLKMGSILKTQVQAFESSSLVFI